MEDRPEAWSSAPWLGRGRSGGLKLRSFRSTESVVDIKSKLVEDGGRRSGFVKELAMASSSLIALTRGPTSRPLRVTDDVVDMKSEGFFEGGRWS